MKTKIESRSKSQMQNCVSGRDPLLTRIERLESREFSNYVVALCFIGFLICGHCMMFQWLCSLVGLHSWYYTVICFVLFSVLVSVFLIIPAMRNATKQPDYNIKKDGETKGVNEKWEEK